MENLEAKLNQPTVEAKSFVIRLVDGEEVRYISDEEKEYQWAPTGSGAIMVMKRTKHKMFGAVLKDERVRLFNQHVWDEVEAIEDGQEAE